MTDRRRGYVPRRFDFRLHDIIVEHSPDEAKLAALGVFSWPIWSCEVSEFPWTRDSRETGCTCWTGPWTAPLRGVMNWQLYIILCSDDSLYTGITTDMGRRFRQHAAGEGAKYFRGRRPVKVIYLEEGHSRSSASKREALVKRLSRAEKLLLARAAGTATAIHGGSPLPLGRGASGPGREAPCPPLQFDWNRRRVRFAYLLHRPQLSPRPDLQHRPFPARMCPLSFPLALFAIRE